MEQEKAGGYFSLQIFYVILIFSIARESIFTLF